MSEENQQNEGSGGDGSQGHSAELLSKARGMGWVPKEEFRGDETKWIDADKYVERGEQMLPIVQASNRRLMGELASTRSELDGLKAALKESQEAIEALKEFNSTTNRSTLEQNRKELNRRLAQARKDGDVDAEVEIQEQLDQVNDSLQESRAKPAEKETKETKSNGSSQSGLSPADQKIFKDWHDENPWFGTDKARTVMATGLANDPDIAPLKGRERLDAIAAKVDELMPTQRRKPKMEGSRGSGGGGGDGGSGNGRSYSDLPADAREACDRQGKRLVGENRAFKTEAEWRKHYCEQYDWS